MSRGIGGSFHTIKLLLALALAGAAFGSTITYTLTAEVSGNLEGNPFTNSLRTITVPATSTIPNAPQLPIDISVGSFSDTLNNQIPSLYSSTGGCSLVLNSRRFPRASVFRTPTGRLIFIANNALAGYAFGENAGPIDDPMPYLTPSTVADNGTITFTSVSNGTFTAVGVPPHRNRRRPSCWRPASRVCC